MCQTQVIQERVDLTGFSIEVNGTQSKNHSNPLKYILKVIFFMKPSGKQGKSAFLPFQRFVFNLVD